VMNLTACSVLPRMPESGNWYRLVATGHVSTVLSGAHTKMVNSRFNAGSLLAPAERFSVMYLADDMLVAQFEYGAILGELRPGQSVPNPRSSFVALTVHVRLHAVVDLTDETTAQIIATNPQELTGDWRGYQTRGLHTAISGPTGIAPTQLLGQALFNTGIEGFRTFSPRVADHKILVVFVDNLLTGSRSLSLMAPI
jgi:RES domain-containing protein